MNCNCTGACRSGQGCSGNIIRLTDVPVYTTSGQKNLNVNTWISTWTICNKCNRVSINGDPCKCFECFPKNEGWFCPNCKKTHSPYINTCPDQVKITDFQNQPGYGV